MERQRGITKSDMNDKIIVIGGGPAGMMAAHTAALYGGDVLLLEKNSRLGRKLLITGKGRCNITNHCDVNTFIQNITTNGRFLYGAASRFSPEDTIAYFENSGLPLKTERGNRVFPQSDRAYDVEKALEQNLRDCGVEIREETVTGVAVQEGNVVKVICESGAEYPAKAVILATGGVSYPLTGSTGDGYRFARMLGHHIISPKASLIPILTEEDWCKKAQGLSLKNVRLTLLDQKEKRVLYEELGEMLFTHFGVSGPLVLSASAHIRNPEPGRYRLVIDLKPGLTETQLDARILRDFKENQNKDFSNSLGALLPRKLIPVVIRLSGIPFDLKVNQITKEMRQKLLEVVKGLSLTVKGFRPVEEAIITSGGVDVKEVSPKTMESKLVQGLYFAGEILDLDAYTGGFNLQIAFSTGYTAGMEAALR
jgi:predicted Rossmann fold flavoprotein